MNLPFKLVARGMRARNRIIKHIEHHNEPYVVRNLEILTACESARYFGRPREHQYIAGIVNYNDLCSVDIHEFAQVVDGWKRLRAY